MPQPKALPRTDAGNFDFSHIRVTHPELAPESDRSGVRSQNDQVDDRSFRLSEYAKQSEELRSLQVPDAERLVAGLERSTGVNREPMMGVGGIGPSSRPPGLGGFYADLAAGRVPRVVGASGSGFDRRVLDEQRSAEIRAMVEGSLRASRGMYTDSDISQLVAFAQALKERAGFGGQSLARLIGRASESIAEVRQGKHPEFSCLAVVTSIGYDAHKDQVQVWFART